MHLSPRQDTHATPRCRRSAVPAAAALLSISMLWMLGTVLCPSFMRCSAAWPTRRMLFCVSSAACARSRLALRVRARATWSARSFVCALLAPAALHCYPGRRGSRARARRVLRRGRRSRGRGLLPPLSSSCELLRLVSFVVKVTTIVVDCSRFFFH